MSETRLYYVGDHFYWRSGTMMSPIYQEGSNARYDWGFVARDLRDGKSIHIRQATPAEQAAADVRLAEIEREKAPAKEAQR